VAKAKRFNVNLCTSTHRGSSRASSTEVQVSCNVEDHAFAQQELARCVRRIVRTIERRRQVEESEDDE